jgi:hypothetical protein
MLSSATTPSVEAHGLVRPMEAADAEVGVVQRHGGLLDDDKQSFSH